MNIREYFWYCPKCHEKVNCLEQLIDTCFDDDDGEAYFAVEKDCGLWLHTISCPKCDAHWIMSISGMYENE